MPSHSRVTSTLLTLALCSASLPALAAELEETVVRASLQGNDAKRASITVFDEGQIAERGSRHLEDLLSAAVNVNAASGASRQRFFQIRGIGERSQFVEPINASVALLIDGIDMTGLGGAAITTDLEQVDILRGPQGTLLGANALAGLIHLHTALADEGDPLRLTAGIERFGGRTLGASGAAKLGGNWYSRLSIQHHESDGFLNNTWLNRSDTNRRDELAGRAALAWVGSTHRIDAALYTIDVDNGYDAFSLDNTRDTLSDQPGRDALETRAARIRWTRTGDINSRVQLSTARTDTDYSYDEDWSYVGIAPGWEYSSFDQYQRDRDMDSLEVRVDGTAGVMNWIGGVYLRREQEQLQRTYTYLPGPFSSALDIDTGAAFGQLDIPLGDTWSAFVGARIERRQTDYNDSQGIEESLDDTLWSGRAGLLWSPTPDHSLYVNISRGVRAGGVNAGLLASLLTFDSATSAGFRPLGFFDEESLINTELGWRWQPAGARISTELVAFSMDRRDQQARGSLVLPRDDGSTAFIDYTNNAARGSNDGVEGRLNLTLGEGFFLEASAGWLRAQFDEFITPLGEDLSGRDQPQAPEFSSRIALNWRPGNAISGGIEATTMDRFFFSDRHATASPGRELLNAHLTWEWDSWTVRLWGRNLTDETFFVRGFGSFGNDPRKEYALEPYFQFGEPRTGGITLEYRH